MILPAAFSAFKNCLSVCIWGLANSSSRTALQLDSSLIVLLEGVLLEGGVASVVIVAIDVFAESSKHYHKLCHAISNYPQSRSLGEILLFLRHDMRGCYAG